MAWLMTDDRWEWDPVSDFRRLRDEVERAFAGAAYGQSRIPAVNVWSDTEKAVVAVQVPGLNPDDLKLSVTGAVLTLEGERRGETDKEGDVIYHRRERGYGRFTRTVRLPFEVEADQVKAQYRLGVLMVHLPRKEETKPRQIAVKGE